MTFLRKKKEMISKMRRKRQYEEQMETSPFKEQKRTFNLEKFNDYKDTEYKEDQEVDDSHIFYSWECVSFLQ